MLANVSISYLAYVLQARATYFSQPLKLGCAFGLYVINSGLYSLQFALKKVLDEKEKAVQKYCHFCYNTTHVDISPTHSMCTALKDTDGTMFSLDFQSRKSSFLFFFFLF